MYKTCIFCRKPLGSNEVVEAFPVGRRLAFDATKGRLWVVCGHCERWNLTPLEERSKPLRLALEMSLHEEDERRALAGELWRLEQAWREAEEIAAIADDLLLPERARKLAAD